MPRRKLATTTVGLVLDACEAWLDEDKPRWRDDYGRGDRGLHGILRITASELSALRREVSTRGENRFEAFEQRLKDAGVPLRDGALTEAHGCDTASTLGFCGLAHEQAAGELGAFQARLNEHYQALERGEVRPVGESYMWVRGPFRVDGRVMFGRKALGGTVK